MSIRKMQIPCLLAIFLLFAAFCAADSFDDAENLANKFLDRSAELRKLDLDESRALVKALCDAEDADRKAVAQDAADRVRSHVNDKYNELRDLRDQALSALDKVIGDDNFSDKKSKAEDYKNRIQTSWTSIDKMTEAVRGSNNPVTAFMLKEGQEAHDAYERNSSNCTVFEWPVAGGRADCINASSCEVIELKPNNSRSIYNGRDQADGYVRELNKGERDYDELVNKNGDFAKCKGKFKRRVACYTLCPEIDDDGNLRSTSVGWDFCD